MSDWGDALYECWRSGGNPDALDREDFEEQRGHEDPDDYGRNEAARQRLRGKGGV